MAVAHPHIKTALFLLQLRSHRNQNYLLRKQTSSVTDVSMYFEIYDFNVQWAP